MSGTLESVKPEPQSCAFCGSHEMVPERSVTVNGIQITIGPSCSECGRPVGGYEPMP